MTMVDRVAWTVGGWIVSRHPGTGSAEEFNRLLSGWERRTYRWATRMVTRDKEKLEVIRQENVLALWRVLQVLEKIEAHG